MLGRSPMIYTIPTGMGYKLSLSLNTKLTGTYMRHIAIKQGNYVNGVGIWRDSAKWRYVVILDAMYGCV